VATAFARGGRATEAAAIAQQLERAPNDAHGVWYARLESRLGRGDTAGALDALEAAAAGDGDNVPALLLSTSWYDPIRASPRFRAALARYRLENSPLTRVGGGRVR
jgi:hypothetical protein